MGASFFAVLGCFLVLGFSLPLHAQPEAEQAPQAVTEKDSYDAMEALTALDWKDPTLAEKIKKAKKVPIVARQRQGASNKCGFYALAHVMSHFDPKAPTGEETYQKALEKGYLWSDDGSSLGGHLHSTLKEFGYRGEYGWSFQGGTVKYLKKMLGKGYGIIVAVRDMTWQGLPIHTNFFKTGGHFVAVEGFVVIDGTEFMIVKDSARYSGEPEYVEKHLEGSSLWPVEHFEAAWSFNLYVALKK